MILGSVDVGEEESLACSRFFVGIFGNFPGWMRRYFVSLCVVLLCVSCSCLGSFLGVCVDVTERELHQKETPVARSRRDAHNIVAASYTRLTGREYGCLVALSGGSSSQESDEPM